MNQCGLCGTTPAEFVAPSGVLYCKRHSLPSDVPIKEEKDEDGAAGKPNQQTLEGATTDANSQ